MKGTLDIADFKYNDMAAHAIRALIIHISILPSRLSSLFIKILDSIEHFEFD